MSAASHRLLTAEEFAALPREGLRLELVRGEIAAMPPAFEDHGEVTVNITIVLGQYVWAHDLGRMFAAETGFLISRNPDTVRAPDCAFIQKSRLPADGSQPVWGRVIPDLVVEVVSSGDRAIAIAEKIRMWLDAGVRLVWGAYPATRRIEAHRPGEAMVTLHEGDVLDGYDVVPGFAAPVAQVFR
jgi:Uma2 family endonuclease